MAETFEAIRRGPGGFVQRVCLKLVQPFFRDKPDFLKMFEREARLAAQLRHSNIVGVIDFGRIEGVTYMALELVDGTDLATLLHAQPGGRLSHDQVALVGQELAQALEHAHDPRRETGAGGSDNTIIHRDLSPSNVMISRRGEVLLTDFGVAKAITGTARQQSAVKGKVPYMSPEHLRAEPLDGRADLFSLGVVLFEALAGERPFQGEHDPAIIMKILRGDRPSLRSMARDAPAGLCDVIESLLEPDPANRPTSATELLELLDPFIPPARERRALGGMATEARKLQTESLTPFARNEGETSGVSRTSGPLAATAPDEGAKPTTQMTERRPLVWVLLATVALGLAWTVWKSETGDFGDAAVELEVAPPEELPPAAAPPPTEMSTTPATDQRSQVDERDESAQDEVDSTPTAETTTTPLDTKDDRAEPRARDAKLDVFVFPWGRVWINGKARGSAPLQNVSLRAGRYDVSAGQDAPSETKTVRLREGDRKTLQFDLTD